MATPLKINHLDLAKFLDKGWSTKKIAAHFGCSPGAVSQAKRRLGVAVCKTAAKKKLNAVQAAPLVVKNADDAKAQISMLIERCHEELTWIKDAVPKKQDGDYRAWQEVGIKHIAEIRKLVSALADIEYKLHHVGVVEKALLIMFEEIGNESPDCQKRIRDRLEKASILFHVDG